MIYVDKSEKQYVHDAFKKAFGDNYAKKELGCYDCIERKLPLKNQKNEIICIPEEKADIFFQIGYNYDKRKCVHCKKREWIRFADIEIGEGRAFYERKTAADFAASQKDRLYLQMNAMDTFLEGRKGIILEGMPRHVKIEDSIWKGYKERMQRFAEMSPLEQAIEISGNRNWTLSFIRECKMRDIEFVQTWNLQETIEFIRQCDAGYDNEPKFRVIPKRYPELPLEQNILIQFKGIGKVKSAKLLENEEIKNILEKLIKKVKESGLAKN